MNLHTLAATILPAPLFQRLSGSSIAKRLAGGRCGAWRDRRRRGCGCAGAISIENDVSIQSIGEGTAVGALCLVAKDLEPFGIYAGSPVKRIKARSQRLLELEKQYLASSGP